MIYQKTPYEAYQEAAFNWPVWLKRPATPKVAACRKISLAHISVYHRLGEGHHCLVVEIDGSCSPVVSAKLIYDALLSNNGHNAPGSALAPSPAHMEMWVRNPWVVLAVMLHMHDYRRHIASLSGQRYQPLNFASQAGAEFHHLYGPESTFLRS